MAGAALTFAAGGSQCRLRRGRPRPEPLKGCVTREECSHGDQIRPTAGAGPTLAGRERTAERASPRSGDPPAPQSPHRMGAAPGPRACADHRRSDLAAVRGRWNQCPRSGRVDAGRRAPVGRSGSARGGTRGEADHPLPGACSPIPIRTSATTKVPKRSTPRISSAGRFAPSRKRCRTSASSATWRSIPIPATVMTASSATASSSTTRPSQSWSARRWSRPRPAAISSPRPT